MFPISGSFIEYTARLRVRGGFTAISPTQCREHPESCAVVQHVLERAPTLTYIVGVGFRHVYSTAVVQPPPPSPPPRLIQYQTGSPAAPPPPPPSPPPWFSGAEQCSPIITAAEAGLQDIITIERERATCAYVRSILDERIDARRCFTAESFAPSPPPPPNNFEAFRGMVDTMLKHENQKKNGLAGAEDAPPLSDEEQYAQQQSQSIASTVSLVERLAETNFQLRDTLAGIQDKIHAGRRLFEASARSYSLKATCCRTSSGTLIGEGLLLGLTSIECSSLCTALGNETSQTGCVATATRMLYPKTPDLSVAACWLLKGLGSCTALDFAAQLYSRRDTNPCDLPSEWKNPLCINLQPEAPFDKHVLTFSMAASACRNGRGSPRLPRAYSSLESMSFVSYARERGVFVTAHTHPTYHSSTPLLFCEQKHAFWAETPRHETDTILIGRVSTGSAFTVPWRLATCWLYPSQTTRSVCRRCLRPQPRGTTRIRAPRESVSAPPLAKLEQSPAAPPPPPPPPLAVRAAFTQFIEHQSSRGQFGL